MNSCGRLAFAGGWRALGIVLLALAALIIVGGLVYDATSSADVNLMWLYLGAMFLALAGTAAVSRR